MPSGATQSVLHQALMRDVRKYVRKIGGYPLKYFAGGPYGLKGMSDYLCAIPIPGSPFAAFVSVEGKTGSATLSVQQKEVRIALEKAHVLYLVVDSDRALEAALLDAGLIETPVLTERLFG